MDLSERSRSEVVARHPWELARSSFFRRLIKGAIDLGEIDTLVDIGGGDGWFAHELLDDLPASATVTCWDINYTNADLDSVLPPRVVRTSEAPRATFDAVLLMDVLEHVEDDELFLADTVVPLVAANGTLIVSVPAHPWLMTAHDTRLGHHRRYRPAQIDDLLARHLRVVESGSLFTSLVPLRAMQRIVEIARGPRVDDQQGVGSWSHGPLLTQMMTAVLTVDARFGSAMSRRGHHLPGLSYWAVCRPLR